MKRLLGSVAIMLGAACATSSSPVSSFAAPSAPAASAEAKSVPAAGSTPTSAPLGNADVVVANVGHIQVLVQRMPGAELVTTALAIRGGVQNLDAQTAGVELLGLRTAASGGTEKLDKDAFSRRLAKLGSTLEASAAPDYSTLQAKSLLGAWEESFDLLADVFLRPALPGTELELQRQQQLRELRQELETPAAALRLVRHVLLFSGTPYANRQVGTEDTVKEFSAEQVRSHLARLRTQSRLLVVVVGDVVPEAVLAKVQRALGGLPEGGAGPQPPAALSFTEPRMEAEERPLPTNYILASFAGPTWQSPDFAAGRLASSILGQREFLEVRTKRNLSYAAGASLDVSRPQAFGVLYVTAVDPAAALPVMQDVVKGLATTLIPDRELAGYRSTFLTGLLEAQGTTDGAAGQLIAAQLLGGDWHLARTLPERIRQATAQDVQAFAKKYMRDYQVAVVGDPKKVSLSLLH
jgi:zinc protease